MLGSPVPLLENKKIVAKMELSSDNRRVTMSVAKMGVSTRRGGAPRGGDGRCDGGDVVFLFAKRPALAKHGRPLPRKSTHARSRHRETTSGDRTPSPPPPPPPSPNLFLVSGRRPTPYPVGCESGPPPLLGPSSPPVHTLRWGVSPRVRIARVLRMCSGCKLRCMTCTGIADVCSGCVGACGRVWVSGRAE